MTKATPTPAAGVQLGRYTVESELGRGGMGVVYAALDETLGRRVAVKTLSAGLLGRDREARMTRFQREVRALAQLDHPGILHIYDAGEADDPVVGWVLYYSMELIEGETLSERLIRCGAMERGAACSVVLQCAEALGSAHRRGIVHRDVKPANIFLAEGGRVVVADFGVCKIEGGQEITRKDQMVGTPSYLAPEQILGLPVDPRTDVFALGALLYVLISNSALRPQLDRAGLSKLAATDDAAWRARHMPNSPEDLRAVVARALARDPADRYASGTELAEALESFATRAPEPFEQPGPGAASGSRAPVMQASLDGSGAFTHGGNTDPGGPPMGLEPGGGDTQVDSGPPPQAVRDEIPNRARRLAHRVNAAGHANLAPVESTDPRAEIRPKRTPTSSRPAMPAAVAPALVEKSDPTEEAALPPPVEVPVPPPPAGTAAEATDMLVRKPPAPPPSARRLWALGVGSALVVLALAAVVARSLAPAANAPPPGPQPGQPVPTPDPVTAAEAVPAAPALPESCAPRPVPVAVEKEAQALVARAAELAHKEPARANEALRKAVKLDGGNWTAHLALARLHASAGRGSDAAGHYACVEQLRRGEPEARTARDERVALKP